MAYFRMISLRSLDLLTTNHENLAKKTGAKTRFQTRYHFIRMVSTLLFLH